MMTTFYDVKNLQKTVLDTKESKRIILFGKIVSVNGSVSPPNRPNFVYFLEYNQTDNAPPMVVFNDSVLPIKDLPVIVGNDPTVNYTLKVLGVYTNGLNLQTTKNIGATNTPLHASNHEWVSEANKGVDKIRIFQPAIQLLKTNENTTGLVLDVNKLVYKKGNRVFTFNGGQLDLSPYLPSAGKKKWVLIGLDTFSNSLIIKEGIETPESSAIDYKPEIPENIIPSSYVKLTSSQTIPFSNIEDIRTFLTSSVSELPTPSKPGEILISYDGLEFVTGETIVDKNGDLVTDENGHIVTF